MRFFSHKLTQISLRRFLPTTLKKQLLVYGTIAVFIAVTLTMLANFQVAEAESRREVQAHLFKVATALQSALEQVGPEEAQQILETFHQDASVEEGHAALLVNLQGLVIASTRPESVGKPVTAVVGDWAIQTPLPQFSPELKEITHRGVAGFGLALPLYGDPANPNRATATLYYIEPFPAHTGLVRRAVLQYFLSGLLLILLLIVPLWFYLERSLLHPLQALTSANEAVAEDRPAERMVPAGVIPSHELGRAIHSRNQMLARLEETQKELHRRLQELTALNRVAETVNRSLNLEETLPGVLEQVLALTAAEAADIRLVENGELRLRAGRGLSADFFEQRCRISLGYCLCGQTALDGRPRMVGDLAQEPFKPATPCLTEGFHTCLSVPVPVKGQMVGVIHLASPRPHLFNAWHQTMLTAVAQYVGLAVEKARIYESERSQRQLADTLRRASQTLGVSLDLNTCFIPCWNSWGRYWW